MIIFTGNYGSGKTEVSVNFTLGLASREPEVSIVDLDVVNPYFRCREAIQPMEEAGIKVIVPRGETFASELPIILPEVKGAMARDTGRLVLDVGGDDVGARVLASFGPVLRSERADLIMVLNARRPFTDTVDGALRIIRPPDTCAGSGVLMLVGHPGLPNGNACRLQRAAKKPRELRHEFRGWQTGRRIRRSRLGFWES